VLGEIQNRECVLCVINKKAEGILRCAETISWRKELVDKRFTNIEPEIGMRRIAKLKIMTNYKKLGCI
jgi:hypothetical protein